MKPKPAFLTRFGDNQKPTAPHDIIVRVVAPGQPGVVVFSVSSRTLPKHVFEQVSKELAREYQRGRQDMRDDIIANIIPPTQ